MAEESTVKVAILGAAFSANKGAASMLHAIVENLPDHIGAARFDVLTTYPHEDAAEPMPAGVRLVPATPIQLLVAFPLALLAWLAAGLRLPQRVFCRTQALRALTQADVVVDLAGISFSDGRGIPTLGYNVLMTGIPLLLKKPVVKASQALGPFKEFINRGMARLVLPRVTTICARGASTEANLMEVGLTNVVASADLAFTMTMPPAAHERARALLPGIDRFVVVLPSSIVETYCERRDVDYAGIMAGFINHAIAGGYHVVIAAHSARPHQAGSGRMNDLPVCRSIHQHVTESPGCTLLDDNLPPDVLRAIIAAADVTVTSRFHAMISALATGTPVIVVGWSHKYQEVLNDFGLEDWAIDYPSLTADALMDRFDDLLPRRSEIAEAIGRGLPEVQRRSRVSYLAVAAAVGVGE